MKNNEKCFEKEGSTKIKNKSFWFQESMIMSNLSLILSRAQQTAEVIPVSAN